MEIRDVITEIHEMLQHEAEESDHFEDLLQEFRERFLIQWSNTDLDDDCVKLETLTIKDLGFLGEWIQRICPMREDLEFPENGPPLWSKRKYKMALYFISECMMPLSLTHVDVEAYQLEHIDFYANSAGKFFFQIKSSFTGMGRFETDDIATFVDELIDILF